MNKKILLLAIITLCLFLGVTSCQDLGEVGVTGDWDGDGWSDDQEIAAGTDPQAVDTDDDGYWDPHDPNPLDPDIPVKQGPTEPAPEEEAVAPPPEATTTEPDTSSENEATTPEAAALELHEVQVAVNVMMRNNNLTILKHPVSVATDDMRRFPDATTRHGTTGAGYVLYLHDFDGDGSPDTNYIHHSRTKGTYTCDAYGKVTQVTTGTE
jgi:hypothetical protein